MEPRPAHLPDFKSPPLNEVVLGVQFTTPENYQQILAGEVWALYRDEYPNVEEHPALPPMFETFGGRPGAQFKLGLITGASHDRFWFLSPERDELIQFQADRLLHNWRKIGDGSNPYPRFERMIAKFQSELAVLGGYFSRLAQQELNINQCEITYINHIVVEECRNPSEWLRFLKLPDGDQEDDFSFTFRNVIRASDGRPLSRLVVEANSAVTQRGKRIIQLNLINRGAPPGPRVDDAIKFLHDGRERIVTKFAELTTESAQQKWERVQ